MSVSTNIFVVPEFVLQTTLTNVLNWIRADFAAAVLAGNESGSWLYRTLAGVGVNAPQGFQRYDFYTQAKNVICLPEDDPRYLEVQLMFNMKRETLPSIYINLPSEQTNPNGNGLGQDEGYFDYEVVDGDPTTHTAGSTTPVFTRRYNAIYNVVVMSDNENESILLHHLVKAMITLTIPHLHFSGLSNIALGGQDIQPYNELMAQLYTRAVSVSLQYEQSVPSMYSQFLPNDIDTQGTPIDPGDDFN